MKYITFAHVFFFPQYCQTFIMCKGTFRVYKHSQLNWPKSSPNSTFIVPTCSSLSPQRDSTNDCRTTLFAHNQPLPVSNLTTKNQVDTAVNNFDDTQSFENPRKHNHSTPEILDSTTTTTLVQSTVN